MTDDLNASFFRLSSASADNVESDFYTLTIPDGGKNGWDRCITICGSRETLSGQFDLAALPKGAVLRQGAAARDFMKQSFAEELRYQREREGKRSKSRNQSND